MFREFKEFAVRGNVIDMAVGIIVGGAFTGVVQSLVRDIIMPPLGYLTGSMDFSHLFIVLREGPVAGPYRTLAAARESGAILVSYGQFVTSALSFLIVAFVVFLMVRYINRLRRPADSPEPVSPAIRKCAYCCSDIAVEASRCPHCTSHLEPAGRQAAPDGGG